jgi:alanine racemase
VKLIHIIETLRLSVDNVPDADIHWLLTDSRTLSFPSESLFFALKTNRNDGHLYIEELYDRRLRYFVVSQMHPSFEKMEDAVFLHVENTLDALQTLASAHRLLFDVPIIGITGSNGKTIVKEWLYQLLHQDYRITRSPRSYNSQIGVPLSVWLLDADTELGIFEAGISEPDEMQRLAAIIRPDIGIFTGIGDAHQEHFTDSEQKVREKIKLFAPSTTIIYASDNSSIDHIIRTSYPEKKLFGWGKSEKADMQIRHIAKQRDKTLVSFIFDNREQSVAIPFTDDASVDDALHCVALMNYLHIDSQVIKNRLLRLEAVGMRLEVKEGIRGCTIINDSYNSDLNSLAIALDFLNQQASDKQLSHTVILSDILQSGEKERELYRQVAALLKSKNIHKLIAVGTSITAQADVFGHIEAYFFPDTKRFLSSASFRQLKDEVILIKGSRSFHFEKITAQLERIVHETILEVNLNALINNFNYFRSKIKPETKIMCMVKAFAYGSGAIEVARTLQHHRCDYLAVALADEGAELRDEGIRIPIVVMNPELNSLSTLFDYSLEPEIYNFRILKAFIAAAEKSGLNHYPIHLKIDSGMHRLGFEPKDIDKLITLLKSQHQVKIRSIFSHLAGADEPELDYFTQQQTTTFDRCADSIGNAFPHHIMRHLLNSAGIERFPQYQYDMVRLGIGHYGISTLSGLHLSTVCRLRSVILQIKTISPHESVGYMRNGKVETETRIAVIPIGYADGFNRKLGNGNGTVYINGQRARLIGNVSMDLITVDLSGIDAKEGDSVEIFGDNIGITEIADTLGTIPYEILTSVSRRVKRVYFQE